MFSFNFLNVLCFKFMSHIVQVSDLQKKILYERIRTRVPPGFFFSFSLIEKERRYLFFKTIGFKSKPQK